jgi:hypothetical protein
MRAVACAVLMLCVSATGCCKRRSSEGPKPEESAGAAAMTAPPTPVWTEHDLKFKEIGASCHFLVSKLDYTVSCRKLPSGTHVLLGEKDEAVDSGGSLHATVDLGPKIATLSPKDATDFRFKLDPGIAMTFRFPGGVELPVQAPALPVWFGIKDALGKVQDGPVPFGKEAAAPPAQHTVLYLGISADTLGPAATMGEVDRVAVTSDLTPRKGKMCTGYRDVGSKGGATRSAQLELQDREVAIYERATGKQLAKKKFEAIARCPLIASGGTARSYPDSEAIKRWLREQRSH